MGILAAAPPQPRVGDFVVLIAIESRDRFDRLCELAVEKERGFSPAVFAGMLAQFSRLRPEEFGVDEARYEQLRRDVDRWRERALELAQR